MGIRQLIQIGFFGLLISLSDAARADENYQLSLSWGNKGGWNGMVITNTGLQPVELGSVTFNNRQECTVTLFNAKAITLDKVDAVRDQQDGLIALIVMAFSMAKFDTGFILTDDITSETLSDALNLNVRPVNQITLQVGEQIAVTKSSECSTIVRVRANTGAGPMEWKLDTPYQ